MEKAVEISKNSKYFWFYPKSKSEIKLVLNNNSKSESKSILKEKLSKKKSVDLVLITVKNEKNTSKLFPENIYVIINFYQIENNRFYSNKDKIPGKVFFKKSTIEKKGFKNDFLKRVVKKFFFDGIETKLLNFKFYSSL